MEGVAEALKTEAPTALPKTVMCTDIIGSSFGLLQVQGDWKSIHDLVFGPSFQTGAEVDHLDFICVTLRKTTFPIAVRRDAIDVIGRSREVEIKGEEVDDEEPDDLDDGPHILVIGGDPE